MRGMFLEKETIDSSVLRNLLDSFAKVKYVGRF